MGDDQNSLRNLIEMTGGSTYLAWLIVMLLITGCHYRKGNSFTWSGKADTVDYIISSSGSGKRIHEKLNQHVWMHESRGDKCQIIYVSDSASTCDTKSILLFNVVLPDYEKDMLTKGLMGTFSTRQIITYLVVTQTDFAKSFTPSVK
jgi:hypothetical protein